ncbi:MAG: lytic murein transglycosylase [bacterium]
MLFSKGFEKVTAVFLPTHRKSTTLKYTSLLSIAFTLFIGVISLTPRISFSQIDCTTPEQKAACVAELANIDQEIKDQQAILDSKQKEGTSISRDIAILDAQIKQAQLKIKAHAIAINNLGKDIVVKTNTITALSEKIGAGQESMAQIIQRTRELDDLSFAESFLSNKNISDFFIDLDNFSSIKESLNLHLDTVKTAKKSNEVVKEELGVERNKEVDAKVNVEQEQAKIKKLEGDKRDLLNLNKNEQQSYKTIISTKTQRANEIRNALFALRDTPAIKFGDAVTYAKAASSKTGVRAAFVLAIIQQESNMGSNVGTCYLTDSTTGAGVKKNSGTPVSNLMKLSRDIPPFLQIMKETGRDPYKTLVSCPIGNSGYGGAMGPSQFIPSTWMLNRNRVASNVGKTYVDPWNPQDALMATAIYLSDLGAGAGGYTAERNAACRYYSGKSCSGSNTFYGDQVMGRVTTMQSNIDVLNAN